MGELVIVRLTYDPDADSALVYLVDHIPPGGAPRSLMCDLEMRDGAVILLMNEEEQLLGIELLGASRLLPTAALNSAEIADRT